MDLREQLDRAIWDWLDALREGREPPGVGLGFTMPFSPDEDELPLDWSIEALLGVVTPEWKAATDDLAVQLCGALAPVIRLLADMAARYEHDCPAADVDALIGTYRPADAPAGPRRRLRAVPPPSQQDGGQD